MVLRTFSSRMRWWVAVEIIERILAEGGKRADEVEVIAVSGSSVSADLRKRKVSHAHETRDFGLGIRTIRNGRIGSSSTSDPARWEQCLEAALASGNLATPQEWGGLPEPANLPRGNLSFDEKVSLDPATAGQLLQGILSGVETYECAEVTSASASLSVSEMTLANSHGILYSDRKTDVSVSAEAICGQSTGFEFDSSCGMDIDPAAVGKRAAFLATHSVNGKDVLTGTCDVILSPLAFAQILGQVIVPALSGRNVNAGRSYLAPFLGQQVFDPALSLYDDPHIPRGLGSSYWDAEGVPTRRLDFIREGTVGCFAYDLKTAYRYGKESTGSAVRGGAGGATSIGSHNLVVGGPRTDICDERALYVENLIGAHTANPMSGDFSVELTNPMWVENGTYGEPVRKAMLAGNAFALLKEIGGLGKETRVLGSMRLPAIRLNSQHIIGT